MRGLTVLNREDEGAVLVLVALSMAVVIGAGMLVVDAGMLWVSRRAVVTAAQSAALAAAQQYAAGEDGCSDPQISALVEDNAPGGVPSCEGLAAERYATVNVVSAPVERAFSRVFGASPITVSAGASARWGDPATVRTVRPIGLCTQDPHVQAALAGTPDPGFDPAPGVHRVYVEPGMCGASGSVGLLDPDGGSSPRSELEDRLAAGYEGSLAPGDCDVSTPVADRCPGEDSPDVDTLGDGLAALVASETRIVVALFDDATTSGGRTRYRLTGFAGAILRGYAVDGGDDPAFVPYIDLELVPVIARGTCCSGSSIEGGVQVVRLCGFGAAGALEGARCSAA